MAKTGLEQAALALAAAVGTLATGAMLGGSSTLAAENVSYRYDARGRLVKVERTGAVNNGVNTSYGYDKANNRTNRNVTGVP